MTDEFKLTMAQLNACVGDFEGNLKKARDAFYLACKEGADMLVLPEMFLTGYQVQDLVQKKAFIDDAQNKLIEFAKECSDGPTIGIVCILAPNNFAQFVASSKLFLLVYFEGSITKRTFSEPKASHAIAATRAESIPPDIPRSAFLKPVFSM